MEPATLCATTEFPDDIDPGALDTGALEKLIAQQPDCMPAHFLRGYAEFDDESADLDAATAYFAQAHSLAPKNAHVLIWLGQAHLMRAAEDMSLGDARSGRTYLEKAVEADPENLDAKAVLAGFYRGAPWIAGGDIDAAYALASEIRKRDLKRGLLEQARTLNADGKEQEALALARSTLQAYPDYAPMAVDYAVLMHQQDDHAEAHRVLLAATAGENADLNALYQLGRTAALSGKFLNDGRAALERYIARGDSGENLPIEEAAVFWRLGMIEQHDGKLDAARSAFERALDFNPAFENAVNALRALDD